MKDTLEDIYEALKSVEHKGEKGYNPSCIHCQLLMTQLSPQGIAILKRNFMRGKQNVREMQEK